MIQITKFSFVEFVYLIVMCLGIFLSLNLDRLSNAYIQEPYMIPLEGSEEVSELQFYNPDDDDSVALEAFRDHIDALKNDNVEYKEAIENLSRKRLDFIHKGKFIIFFLLCLNCIYAVLNVNRGRHRTMVIVSSLLAIIVNMLFY